jgi:enoyl-CoA hydratase/carnithine racemase
MTNDERLAYLLDSIWVPTNRPVLFADITAIVGLEATALIVGTMKAASATNPLMDTIIIAMSTNGLSLSTAERQGVIDALATAGQWPTEVRNAVKALGGASKPRWQTLGYEIAPTLESVTLAATKRQLEDSAVDALQAFREALSAWDGSGDAPVLGGG